MALPTIYITSDLDIDAPKGIAVDTDRNRLLICDSGNDRLVWCKIQGLQQISTLSTYGANSFSAPSGALYHKGCFYISDSGNHTVVRLSARDLSYKDHFGTVGSSGSTNSKLNTPADLATDGVFLYVADKNNSRIMKLNLETLAYVAKTSNINGALSRPEGIAYKREAGEALFIADTSNNRIIKCDPDFVYIEQNNTNVTSPLSLLYYNDLVYVCNGGAGADDIVILASDGLAQQTTLEDTTILLSTPAGIARWEKILLISDSGNDRLTAWKVYDPRDAFTQATVAKFGGGFFDNPLIVVDDDEVIAGDTQESGSVNRWKEENPVHSNIGWVEE